MLVSPPEKLLQAGIKVKRAQLDTTSISTMALVGTIALGLIFYFWYRHNAYIEHQQQIETISAPHPMGHQDALQQWDEVFSRTGI